MVLYASKYSLPQTIELRLAPGMAQVETRMVRGLLGIFVTGEEDPAWAGLRRER